MKSASLRTLAGVVMVLATAGCGDAPTGATAAADTPQLSTTTALTVTIDHCTYQLCGATASGGTGTGYSFTWTNAAENYDTDGSSIAYPKCPVGLVDGVYINVGATVTDSSGADATAYQQVYCPSRSEGGEQPLY